MHDARARRHAAACLALPRQRNDAGTLRVASWILLTPSFTFPLASLSFLPMADPAMSAPPPFP